MRDQPSQRTKKQLKIYILDTSVFIDDLQHFVNVLKDEENYVLVLNTNYSEIDKLLHKRSSNPDAEIGARLTRDFFSDLDTLGYQYIHPSSLPFHLPVSAKQIPLLDFAALSDEKKKILDRLLREYHITSPHDGIQGKLLFTNAPSSLSQENNPRNLERILEGFNPSLSSEDLTFLATTKLLSDLNAGGEDSSSEFSSSYKDTNKSSQKKSSAKVTLLTLDRLLVSTAIKNKPELAELPKEGRRSPENLFKGYRFVTWEEFFKKDVVLPYKKGLPQTIFLTPEIKNQLGINETLLEELTPGEYLIFVNDQKEKELFFKKSDSVFDPKHPAYPLPNPKMVYRFQRITHKNEVVPHLQPMDKRLITGNLKALFQSFHPKSFESYLALNSLLDTTIRYFLFYGPQGTGKTYTALYFGLLRVLYSRFVASKDDPLYDPDAVLYITKPIVGFEGAEHETLRGGIIQKEFPYYFSVRDNYQKITRSFGKNLAVIKGNKLPSFEQSVAFEELDLADQAKRDDREFIIRINPLRTIRGRSFSRNSVILIDEAQNLSRRAVKELMLRGEETTMFFVGDPYQLDVKYNSPNYNGITQLIESTFRPLYFSLDLEVEDLFLQQSFQVIRFENFLRSDRGRVMLRRYAS